MGTATTASKTTPLARLMDLRKGERIPLMLAALAFFCILTGLMMLRPARDALGMQRGIEAVRWLFIGTAFVTLLANPAFGWLASRLPRLPLVAVTYGFFAASLLGFFTLLTLAPEAIGMTSGQVFYVWFSVFNLFATMTFWALMADRFTLTQSKRLFPPISVGGTLGAIFGPWLASVLAPSLGTAALLPISAAFLVAAALAAWGASRGQTSTAADAADRTPGAALGGGAWAGLQAIARSPYLAGLAAYVVIMAIVATFLYFTRLQMVAALGDDIDLRTGLFARIDLYTQLATLLLQALLAARLIRWLGVAGALVVLPLTVMAGFAGLVIMGSLAALIVFEATFRAVQRGLTRPARETLYTVLGREDKYKAKAAIDTFVYRGGDVIGAQVEGLLGKLGAGLSGLALTVLPIALVWAALGLWLGRTQGRLASSQGMAVRDDFSEDSTTLAPEQR